MHMNSVPQYLLNEDRQEYDRLLDEALRSAPHRPELAAVGQRLNPEQLRTLALNATAFITAAAATEYQHYVKAREELRQPASATSSSVHESDPSEPGAGTMGLATGIDGAAETAGAGAVAVVAVLAPVLAGTAAAIFLLVGYILRMLSPELAFAQTMLTAGWVFGAVTAAAILVAAIGLLVTALRNRPSPEATEYDELTKEVDRAREAWRSALLERGFLPFLRESLADPETAATLREPTTPAPPSTPSARAGRIPQLGYGRPGFSSPDDSSGTGHRPRFSSPDYSSPDFGGPENKPE
ncbi:hypothetical protein ACIQOU_10215 [Streptomyces sp. NPDC091279]|uniref:hypothetical protein n=1 Tax=unclassified Streptomyces TaxID=2593676 RepID=UPI00381D3D33